MLNSIPRAVDAILNIAKNSVRVRGRFTMALSGGNTPEPLYRALVREDMPWKETHLFWGDERVVPPGHPQSNYVMADEAMISHLSIPPSNVHQVPLDKGGPNHVARFYEEQLRAFFGGLPQFDLILLGMGSDGHTASLFPGDASLAERERWVVAVDGTRADPPVPRITFTLPVINNARNVIFLISGEEKKRIADEIMQHPGAASKKYPAAMVQPHDKLLWIIL